jgi:excisionase family DNA binding protein
MTDENLNTEPQGEEMEMPEVMGIDHLSEYLGLSRSTLYKLLQEGKIPARKVGRHWRAHKPTIDRWLDGGFTPDQKSTSVDQSL